MERDYMSRNPEISRSEVEWFNQADLFYILEHLPDKSQVGQKEVQFWDHFEEVNQVNVLSAEDDDRPF